MTLTISERLAKKLLKAIDGPSCTDKELATFYYRLKDELTSAKKGKVRKFPNSWNCPICGMTNSRQLFRCQNGCGPEV